MEIVYSSKCRKYKKQINRVCKGQRGKNENMIDYL